MDDKIFIANDLDLNLLDKESLKMCCDYNLLIETEYPKLVVYLFSNDKFKDWLSENNIGLNDVKVIKLLINAIKLRTVNLGGELIIKKINLMDRELWVSIVDQFLSDEDIIQKKMKNNNSGIIIRRKKSLKKNVYQMNLTKGKDISISI